jgi:hypothetical protein
MSSSSTIVNVAEDAELRLVRLLSHTAKSGSFVQDCEACIANGDASQLLRTVIKDAGALGALFVLEPSDEAVSAFSLLTALLTRVGRGEEEQSLTKLLADAVANIQMIPGKDVAEVAQRQVSLLSVLYNMRASGHEKCALLARMVQIAGARQPSLLEPGKPLGDMIHEDLTSNMPNVAPERPRIVAMLDAWQVPVPNRRELFLAAARGIPAGSPRKQRFLLLFVESYNVAVSSLFRKGATGMIHPFLSRPAHMCLIFVCVQKNQVDEQGLNIAKEAALGAIVDPMSLFIHQRCMLSMPAIQALAANPGASFVCFLSFEAE